MIKMIMATDPNGVIGKDNGIPWKIKEDMMFFKETTLNSILIMGRKTWDSLGRRALPKRGSIIVTRDMSQYNPADYDRTAFVESVESAVEMCKMLGQGNGFVIGGSQIYEECILLNKIDTALISHIKAAYEGDATFPMELLEGKPRTLIKSYSEFDVYEYDMRK